MASANARIDALDDVISFREFQPLVESDERPENSPHRYQIRISPDADLDELTPYLGHLAAIWVEVERFTDGRAFSIGRVLRQRLNFTGALGIIGDVLPDQLESLRRCGFDHFPAIEPIEVLFDAYYQDDLIDIKSQLRRTG